MSNSTPDAAQNANFANDASNQGIQAGRIDNLVVNQGSLRPGRSDSVLLHDYYSSVIQVCNKLSFGDPHSGRPGREPMRLAKVFTMLRVHSGETVIAALSRIGM